MTTCMVDINHKLVTVHNLISIITVLVNLNTNMEVFIRNMAHQYILNTVQLVIIHTVEVIMAHTG